MVYIASWKSTIINFLIQSFLRIGLWEKDFQLLDLKKNYNCFNVY